MLDILTANTLWEFIDNNYTVSLYNRISDGSIGSAPTYGPVFSVQNTIVRGIDQRTLRSIEMVMETDLLQKIETIFYLWTSQLGGGIPHVNDRIVDWNGINWTVVYIPFKNLQTRYACYCIREV